MAISSLQAAKPLADKPSVQTDAQEYMPANHAPWGLIFLDFVGLALLIIGLKQQFGEGEMLHPVMRFDYIGLVLIMGGLMLTLPFLTWAIKTCFKVMSKITD